MRPIRRTSLASFVLTLSLMPARAHAEPIVISGGFLTSTGLSNTGRFDFVGAGFKWRGSPTWGW